MADAEATRERGNSLMFIGFALFVADLLVVFYLPSAVKLGRQDLFLGIMAGLGLLAVVLMSSGYWKRRKAGAVE